MFETTSDFVWQKIQPRPRDAHKGIFGSVLAVAGSASYRGAAALAVEGALRTGAGIVTLASVEPVLAAVRPGSLIVDLASKPGGTDFAAAQRLGCKAIHALSLPAACAPDTAGEAVARTVLTILREREEHT